MEVISRPSGRGNNGVVDIHLFGKAFFGRKNKSSNYLIRIYAGFTKKLEEPVTTLERHALVTSSEGEKIRIEDCGFRMLEPHEIQAAMAFPPEYVVLGNRREKIRQLGNAVTPPVMKLLMQRCLASLA